MPPGTYFDLGVLKHFKIKNQTRKIATIYKNFDLYQVLMYVLCHTVPTFTAYILPTKIIETFWSGDDVTDTRVFAHFEPKIYQDF